MYMYIPYRSYISKVALKVTCIFLTIVCLQLIICLVQSGLFLHVHDVVYNKSELIIIDRSEVLI